MALLLFPEQATSSAAATSQRPAPTLHEPCLDERSLGERGDEGGVFIKIYDHFYIPPTISVTGQVKLDFNHINVL